LIELLRELPHILLAHLQALQFFQQRLPGFAPRVAIVLGSGLGALADRIEDAVAGVSAVLADGRTVHTRVAPRRSTGPDLLRARCGSEGTIGFITSAVLRIHPKPEARLVAAYILPSVDAAVSAVLLALREDRGRLSALRTARRRAPKARPHP
jgi:FAD/FMN-containing dehydrogenase